jgi:hypothetical protein
MKVEMLICSNLWNGVDESEINLSPNDPTIQLTWKDSKAHASIFSRCGKKPLIFLRQLTTFKVEWNGLKQIYQHPNEAF